MKKNKNIELSELEKTNPFKVPENYFDEFSTNLMQKINDETTFTLSFWQRAKPYIFAAAIIVVAIFPSIPAFNKVKQNTEITQQSDLYSYLMNEMDEDFLVDYLSEKY